jgi:MFS transporter, SP family, general alpha glucoside:H+ symporter
MAHDATGDTNTPPHFVAENGLNPTKSMNQITHNAKNATDKEHKMTLLQGIRLYPKAIAWSVLISTCICMEGYDVCLLSNFCKFSHRHYDDAIFVKIS